MNLLNAPIRNMEPAIVERLRLAFPEKTFAIERVPQTMTIKEFETISRRSPFIGLAWTGMRPDTASGRVLKGKMLWRLILVYKASSTLDARFKGDARGLGLDAMIDVSVALLQGAEIPGVGFASVTLANSIIADGWSDDAIVIAQVDFDVTFTANVAGFGLKTLDEFLAFGVTWAIPGDDAAATDELTIPAEE
ncbi:hypothetical protein [Rhizobium metallidurans]|uniref:DUF1834 family protein n=1 Tax=Rhizobium metallidurans TaxID=1265931 RepID=A0A7W6CR71_9HYPH|nr:hypothetical protein [Rhizobium metallidurans]MBB3963487.1 hypothetical protein [Rhizobium metallidurans]